MKEVAHSTVRIVFDTHKIAHINRWGLVSWVFKIGEKNFKKVQKNCRKMRGNSRKMGVFVGGGARNDTAGVASIAQVVFENIRKRLKTFENIRKLMQNERKPG